MKGTIVSLVVFASAAAPSASLAQSGWARQSSPTTNTLLGVSFVDANTGWAVGGGGTILHTTTGGE